MPPKHSAKRSQAQTETDADEDTVACESTGKDQRKRISDKDRQENYYYASQGSVVDGSMRHSCGYMAAVPSDQNMHRHAEDATVIGQLLRNVENYDKTSPLLNSLEHCEKVLHKAIVDFNEVNSNTITANDLVGSLCVEFSFERLQMLAVTPPKPHPTTGAVWPPCASESCIAQGFVMASADPDIRKICALNNDLRFAALLFPTEYHDYVTEGVLPLDCRSRLCLLCHLNEQNRMVDVCRAGLCSTQGHSFVQTISVSTDYAQSGLHPHWCIIPSDTPYMMTTGFVAPMPHLLSIGLEIAVVAANAHTGQYNDQGVTDLTADTRDLQLRIDFSRMKQSMPEVVSYAHRARLQRPTPVMMLQEEPYRDQLPSLFLRLLDALTSTTGTSPSAICELAKKAVPSALCPAPSRPCPCLDACDSDPLSIAATLSQIVKESSASKLLPPACTPLPMLLTQFQSQIMDNHVHKAALLSPADFTLLDAIGCHLEFHRYHLYTPINQLLQPKPLFVPLIIIYILFGYPRRAFDRLEKHPHETLIPEPIWDALVDGRHHHADLIANMTLRQRRHDRPLQQTLPTSIRYLCWEAVVSYMATYHFFWSVSRSPRQVMANMYAALRLETANTRAIRSVAASVPLLRGAPRPDISRPERALGKDIKYAQRVKPIDPVLAAFLYWNNPNITHITQLLKTAPVRLQQLPLTVGRHQLWRSCELDCSVPVIHLCFGCGIVTRDQSRECNRDRRDKWPIYEPVDGQLLPTCRVCALSTGKTHFMLAFSLFGKVMHVGTQAWVACCQCLCQVRLKNCLYMKGMRIVCLPCHYSLINQSEQWKDELPNGTSQRNAVQRRKQRQKRATQSVRHAVNPHDQTPVDGLDELGTATVEAFGICIRGGYRPATPGSVDSNSDVDDSDMEPGAGCAEEDDDNDHDYQHMMSLMEDTDV